MKKIFISLLFSLLIIEIYSQINMTSSGNVGIGGITSPITRLHINGQSYLSDGNSHWIAPSSWSPSN